MGGSKIKNNNDKKITFKAAGAIHTCGQQQLQATVQYPHTTPACGGIKSGTDVTLSMGATGNPTFTPQSIQYVATPSSTTPIASENIPMNGSTPVYMKAVFKNSSTAAVRSVKLQFVQGVFSVIDTANMYIQVDNGPVTKVYGSTIYQTDPVRSNQMWGYLKNAFKTRVNRIWLKTPVTVPVGSALNIYYATINGDIHDNEKMDVFHPNKFIQINGAAVQVVESEGFCNNINKTYVQRLMQPLYFTHYQEKPSLITFKDQETKTVKILANPGSFKQTPAVFTAKAPSWLTITDIKLIPQGAAFPAGVAVSYNTISTNECSAKIVSTGSRTTLDTVYLQVTYKAPVCGSVNKNDTIWYTAKQEWSGGAIDKISQVSQPIQFKCMVEGVGLDTFYVHRVTGGYPDVDNDGNPESTTPASDAIITHTQYLPSDMGSFYWKGKIGPSGNYKYLDIPLDAVKAIGRGFFTMGEGDFAINLSPASGRTVLLNGAAASNTTITYHRKDDTKGYFRIYKSDGFPHNATIEVKAPFGVTKKVRYEAIGDITSGFYVSQNAIPDPYNAASNSLKVGEDVSAVRLTIPEAFSAIYPAHDMVKIFNTRAPKLNARLGSIAFYPNKLPNVTAPISFDKEARFISYPKRITIDLPAGYSLDDSLNIHRYSENSSGINVKKINHPISRVNNPDGSTKITWDLTDLYQTTNIAGPLAPGKWRLPEENWGGIFPKGNLRVDPTAPGFKDSTKFTVSCEYWDPNTDQPYKDPYTGLPLVRKTDNILRYNFDVKLRPLQESTTAYGSKVSGPPLEMQNNSSATLQHLYYYFDGPIKNVTMKSLDDGTVYSYTATTPNKNGCWVKVANLPNAKYHTYELTYTDTVPQCGDHTVKVYTASGFSSSWTPNTAAAYNPVMDPNFVEQTKFTIKHTQSTMIKGQLDLHNTAKADTVPEGSTMMPPQTYTLRATFNTSSSDGMVKKLEMDLTVPTGQIYVPGSAQIEYPIGTFHNVPSSSALETALATLANATDSANGRPKTVRLKLNESGIATLGTNFILPGSQTYTALADSVYLKARLHMKFRAVCNTPFRGFQYFGKVYGQTICDVDAGGNGSNMPSRLIYPDVTFGYKFDVSVHTTTTSYAFNEGRRNDTVVLHINKYFGHTADMKHGDYLEVVMPPELNLDGNSIRYTTGSTLLSAINGKVETVTDNTTTATERRLKISFPVSEYNGEMVKKGVGEEILCYIPVVYTPNGQTRAANPVDSVQARVWSDLLFGDCKPVSTIFGEGKRKVGLFTAIANPHIAWIGDTARFQITSHGFDGQWYKTKTGGTAASSSNPWVNIPLDTSMVGDTVFYFTPSINGNSFGNVRLPYYVRIWLRPWFIRNLPHLVYVCGASDTLRVKAGGMDVRYQWFQDGNPIVGATGTTLVVTSPGLYHVMVRDSVTPPNIIYSDTTDVVFREYPVITKDLEDIVDCDNLYRPLAVRHTGRFMRYQWYRNGLPIPGATDSVYRASAYDSSSFYRVKVMNPCGDSVMSSRCYVDFCELKWGEIVRTVELFAPATVETQPAGKRHQLTSRYDFNFTLRALGGQSLRYVTITADHPAWTENGGGIERSMISDSLMTVRVRRVNKNLRIYVNGVTPLTNLTVDPSIRRVWTFSGRLYIHVDRPQSVRLYTVMGHLYREQSLPAGQTVIDRLPSGFYIVRFADGMAEKVRVE